jgi:hypothetical protein
MRLQDEDKKFKVLRKYIKENYGSHFYLGKASASNDLEEWCDRNEVYRTIIMDFPDIQ